jgi:hypothetical protein
MGPSFPRDNGVGHRRYEIVHALMDFLKVNAPHQTDELVIEVKDNLVKIKGISIDWRDPKKRIHHGN